MPFADLTEVDIFNKQRTKKGLRYEKERAALTDLLFSSDAKDREKAKRLNDSILRLRGVAPGDVHSNTFIANMSVQYANDMYIGEQLMPAVPVTKLSDRYAIYPKRERFAYPDDALGTRARAAEIDESRTFGTYSLLDYGFSNYVDAQTLENQDAPFNEMVDLTEAILEGIAFRREKRIATILTTGANYSGNTAALSGSDRWDSGTGGDPVRNILDACAATWQGRGATELVGFCSLDVYNVMARHPALRDLFKYSDEGLATPEKIARYFGMSRLLVGAAREDTADIGQTASYGRIWGRHFGVVRVMRSPSLRTAAFGVTFRQNGDPVTDQWYDQSVGKRGGYYGRVATSEDHKVIAGDAGYLFTTVIS